MLWLRDANTLAMLAQIDPGVDVLDWILKGGLPAFLLLLVFAFTREKPLLVPGPTHRAAVEERDAWRDAFFKLLGTTERAADATDLVAKAMERQPPVVNKQVQLTEQLIEELQQQRRRSTP